MSGGRFLVSLKDIQVTEKFLKIKSLVHARINIDSSGKINPVCDLNVERILTDFEAIMLNTSTSFKAQRQFKRIL